MTDTMRDTKFAGFARLQMPELDSLFAVLYHAYATGDQAKRDEYSQRIQTYLAQRAYDLASSIAIDAFNLQECTDTYRLIPDEEILAHMQDLTQWPESLTPE